jgi:hypothetical protein
LDLKTFPHKPSNGWVQGQFKSLRNYLLNEINLLLFQAIDINNKLIQLDG